MLRLLFGRVAGSRIGVASNKCNLASVSTKQSIEDTSDPSTSEAHNENSTESPMNVEGGETIPLQQNKGLPQNKGLSNRITVDGFLFSSCMYRKDDSGAIQSATFQLRHRAFEDGVQQDMFTVKVHLPQTIIYALNNLHAGSKVRIKGRLGLKNAAGDIAIVAHYVTLLDAAKSNAS